ncbi:hypothetical protein F5Y11DRAFT_231488 [Daldinia sp. FL1419]|nr:hypothetical protein F5Y11DRAFT_231488 [Daldinia sp. FL1419]
MSLTYWIFAVVVLGFAIRVLSTRFILLSTFISRCSYYYSSEAPRPPSEDSLESAPRSNNIASFAVLGNSNLKSRLMARAIPNKRLIETFGISNALTTTSVGTYRRFMAKVRPTVKEIKPGKWLRFHEAASTTLDLILAQSRGIRSVPLAILTRQLVFVSILNTFFDTNPSKVNFEEVTAATNLINRIWVESKAVPRPNLKEERRALEDALKQILPDRYPWTAKENPLNIIIPAYETMWRVVLLTFITVGFRSVDQETTDQFREVIESVPECLESGRSEDTATTALNFAKEGLRLYPPTKRIYRSVPLPGTPLTKEMAADVEKCHRDPDIWVRPEEFRPERFHPDEFTKAMGDAYLPFSIPPHRCPAADNFAPHAVIVLVVVLARGLGTVNTGSSVKFGDDKLDRDRSALLPAGRMDMEGWELEMGNLV